MEEFCKFTAKILIIFSWTDVLQDIRYQVWAMLKVFSVWHSFCITLIEQDGIKLIPHCSCKRHLSYKATSFMDTGEYICQLRTRNFMELPIPLPPQEVEHSVCHFQKMLFSINYRTTKKEVFQHYTLTRQNGVKINRKLKSYPPLLLGQLLKYLHHLTCYLKHQWFACSSKSSWFWTTICVSSCIWAAIHCILILSWF